MKNKCNNNLVPKNRLEKNRLADKEPKDSLSF